MRFPDQFLCALGAWQNGWGEDADRRLRITENLITAISETLLPPVALAVDAICYRKRFLVPWNPQNDADFFPLFQQGFISEGIASWTTDLLFAKNLKGAIRGGAQAAIFAAKPTPNEVILNIAALNALPEFRAAVAS